MSTPPAFQSQDAPKPLPFDPSKLKGLSEQMIRSHWENNYGGSVKALAAVKARLAQAAGDKDLPPYVYNDLKREHLIRTGSVVLHELYFENLGGSSKAAPAERDAISEAFGSFDEWEAEFRRIGTGLAGGSGWVILGFNLHTRQLENIAVPLNRSSIKMPRYWARFDATNYRFRAGRSRANNSSFSDHE